MIHSFLPHRDIIKVIIKDKAEKLHELMWNRKTEKAVLPETERLLL